MKSFHRAIPLLTGLIAVNGLAQTSLGTQPGDSRIPPQPTEINPKKAIPGDQGFSDLDLVEEAIKKSQQALKDTADASRKDESAGVPKSDGPTEGPPPEYIAQAEVVDPAPKLNAPPDAMVDSQKAVTNRSVRKNKPAEVFLPENGTTVFNQNLKTDWQEDSIILPGLSSAYATILFGEEVAATETEWVAARLDYAFLGPNGSVMELNGCRVDIDIRANFNSGKVKGALKKIFCRSKDGRVFSQDLTGKMISAKTEYGGVESKIIMSGPARGAALEAIQTITKGVGSAMAAAQVTEQAASTPFSSLSTKNVTGDKEKYISGKALEASGDFLQYAVDFYKGLSPTQAVPPGSKVHLVIKDSVQIPKEFFTKKINIQHLERDLRG